MTRIEYAKLNAGKWRVDRNLGGGNPSNVYAIREGQPDLYERRIGSLGDQEARFIVAALNSWHALYTACQTAFTEGMAEYEDTGKQPENLEMLERLRKALELGMQYQ